MPFGTSSWGGRRYLPLAFTEQGVAMLSSVLRSSRAVLVNIAIMRAFVKLREISRRRELARRFEEMESRYDAQFRAVEAMSELMAPTKNRKGELGLGLIKTHVPTGI